MTIFERVDRKRVQVCRVCRCAGVAGVARCIVSSRLVSSGSPACLGGEEGVNLQIRAKGNKSMLASVELDGGAAQGEKAADKGSRCKSKKGGAGARGRHLRWRLTVSIERCGPRVIGRHCVQSGKPEC